MKKQFLNLMKGFLFALMWIISLCMHAQNITVRGTVTDTHQEVLVGVTVKLHGALSTVTDIDGNFSFQIYPDGTLEVSYGYGNTNNTGER